MNKSIDWFSQKLKFFKMQQKVKKQQLKKHGMEKCLNVLLYLKVLYLKHSPITLSINDFNYKRKKKLDR